MSNIYTGHESIGYIGFLFAQVTLLLSLNIQPFCDSDVHW